MADKALLILMSESELEAKKLQKRLQEKFNVVIGYDTIWTGKEKAMTELYDTWEENFQQLLRWKAAVLEVSPDTVIEVDCHMDGEKRYFLQFFVHLDHVLKVLEMDVDLISVWTPLDWMTDGVNSWSQLVEWMIRIGCTQSLSGFLALRRMTTGHGSWRILWKLLEIHLCWLSQVMHARG
jgi:hypothetical protein